MYHKFKQYNIIDRNIILIRLKFGFYHWLLGESCIFWNCGNRKFKDSFGYPLYSVVTSRLFPYAPVKIPEVLRWVEGVPMTLVPCATCEKILWNQHVSYTNVFTGKLHILCIQEIFDRQEFTSHLFYFKITRTVSMQTKFQHKLALEK